MNTPPRRSAESVNPDLVCVAVIGGAHGVRGDVRVKSFTERPENCFDYAPFVDKAGEAVITPKSWRAAKDGFIVTPTKPRQKEEWDGLKGTLLYVSKSSLPDTDEDEFYIEDLIGLTVKLGDDDGFGTIRAVHNFGSDDLLEIGPEGDLPSFVIPFTLECVPEINVTDGFIRINPHSDYLPDEIL